MTPIEASCEAGIGLRRPRAPRAWLLRVPFVLYVGILVGLPLTAVVVAAFAHGGRGFAEALSSSTARSALLLSLGTSAVVALVNVVTGTLTAYVLVRGRFRGRALLSSVIELPFALPTLLPGILLVLLLGPQTAAGAFLASAGMPVAYARTGIVLVLFFVTLPFVVRAVEPVLRELDTSEEEAAAVLGASPLVVFRRVVLPALTPAIATGALQAFGRALAEFGSIVVVSGNIPGETLTAPALIHGEVESGRLHIAAALSLVLLGCSLTADVVVRRLTAERKMRRRRA